MGTLVESGISILTSAMTFVTGNAVFSGLIGTFVALGVVGGLISIFRRWSPAWMLETIIEFAPDIYDLFDNLLDNLFSIEILQIFAGVIIVLGVTGALLRVILK